MQAGMGQQIDMTDEDSLSVVFYFYTNQHARLQDICRSFQQLPVYAPHSSKRREGAAQFEGSTHGQSDAQCALHSQQHDRVGTQTPLQLSW